LDALALILLGLLPCLAVFAWLGRRVFAFMLGFAGWVAALLARLPLLQVPLWLYGEGVAVAPLYLVYASLLAGVFEEGVRFLAVWKVDFVRSDWRSLLSFGLGWGLVEALLLYALSAWVAVYVFRVGVGFEELLAGAVERNLAVLIHVSLSFVVFRALARRMWLLVAVAVHALVDVAATFSLRVFGLGLWGTEGVVALCAAFTAMLAWISARRLGLNSLPG